ncbi:MAG: heme-binding protein [Halobacteria archaeon]
MNYSKIAAVAGGSVLAVISYLVGRRMIKSYMVDEVDYQTLGYRDDVEIRKYPETVSVETTAEDETDAFRRLHRYIEGENIGENEIKMTAPVRTDETVYAESTGVEKSTGVIETATPVKTDVKQEGVTMAFYLPGNVDFKTAPTPRDPRVELVKNPPKTLAVKEFSWWATPEKTEKVTRQLLSTLGEHDIRPKGDPFLQRYDDPLTPPFLRTNEVCVEVLDL